MTRKQAHAQAVQFLREAADAIDEAYAQAKDAQTIGAISTKLDAVGGSYIGLGRLYDITERMWHEADTTVCDDCGLLIAACDCKWANQDIEA